VIVFVNFFQVPDLNLDLYPKSQVPDPDDTKFRILADPDPQHLSKQSFGPILYDIM
jgi:hypothetical protein